MPATFTEVTTQGRDGVTVAGGAGSPEPTTRPPRSDTRTAGRPVTTSPRTSTCLFRLSLRCLQAEPGQKRGGDSLSHAHPPAPGRQHTHHGLGESAELHVVGGENGLLVALDEGRLLRDQPQPVLQARIPVTAGPRGRRGRGGRREAATLTASMTTGTPLAFDASKMPWKKRNPTEQPARLLSEKPRENPAAPEGLDQAFNQQAGNNKVNA